MGYPSQVSKQGTFDRMSDMLEKIQGIEDHYDELGQQLEQSSGDYLHAAELSKERSDLEPLVTAARAYRETMQRVDEARQLQFVDDEELRQLAQTELAELEPQIETMEKQLKNLLLPKDPRDDHNVIVEIRAGTGGDEAALFAADLLRMYSRYAERRNWKMEILSQNETGIGGYKEIIFMIKGKGAYSKLKYEFRCPSRPARSGH